jgi:5'-deoxynucleotidase YfbR-like HD superfamily hydrolase
MDNNNLDTNIFGDKKLKDLFKEIYDNQKKKEKQISALIDELKPMVQEIGDATLVVPLIKEYLEIGVKNDEQLIKLGTIIQRVISSNNSGANGENGFSISEEEKAQLLDTINKVNKPE